MAAVRQSIPLPTGEERRVDARQLEKRLDLWQRRGQRAESFSQLLNREIQIPVRLAEGRAEFQSRAGVITISFDGPLCKKSGHVSPARLRQAAGPCARELPSARQLVPARLKAALTNFLRRGARGFRCHYPALLPAEA